MENIVEKHLTEKDEEIKNLVKEVKTLQEKLNNFEEMVVEKPIDNSIIEEPKNMLDCTFVNPNSVFSFNFCEFKAKSKSDLDTHIDIKHKEKELKFQLYAIVVSPDFNTMEVRKDIIEHLEQQKEIEKVLSVFVDGRGGNPATYDTDSKLLIEADIKIVTKATEAFENTMIRDKLFKECKIRLTKPFRGGHITREEFLRFRNETGWRSYY